MGRFTYFDFIAYVVPGALIIGTISLLVGADKFPLITRNPAIDTLLFLILSFTIGAFFHQLSRYSVESLIRRLFWHGRFYSDIYLVNHYGLCREPSRTHILKTAQLLFGFDRSSLSSLDCKINIKSPLDPHAVSHQIFRRFDSHTMDNGLARKGHLANAFYSLYRSMTLATFTLGILLATSYRWGTSTIGPDARVALVVLSFVASVVFLIRTRNEGQRYVQGVLASVSGSKLLKDKSKQSNDLLT